MNTVFDKTLESHIDNLGKIHDESDSFQNLSAAKILEVGPWGPFAECMFLIETRINEEHGKKTTGS